jgi:hypothetical protein
MSQFVIFLAPAAGVFALIFVGLFAWWVIRLGESY